MNSIDFWNNKDNAEKVISRNNELSEVIKKAENIDNKINEIREFSQLDDPETISYITKELESLEEYFNDFEIELLLSEEYDNLNAILEITPGAGGTESCDWASMLYRMYLRYAEKKGYKAEILNEQQGEEAGIKSVSIKISGNKAYGYLKGEKGVHRLIRISPFDSGKRRHTSFASIDITPEIISNDELTLDEKDLKIDVYRSSGAGGQSVNTTDSAVRVTHLPTGMVVTCQNERSQLKNKESAISILKSKLLKIKYEEEQDKLNKIKGENKQINFGSQIRSYILCPYKLVKDHRTNAETSNVDKVLDGDLDIFINEYLRERIK